MQEDIWCVELLPTAENQNNLLHIDTLTNIETKNRRMREYGRTPAYVVIGEFPTVTEATAFAAAYRLTRTDLA